MKLIDKDALVAEIEKRINKEIQSCATDTLLGYSQGCVDSMRNVLSFLDTLEVKEVDLEKETQALWRLNQKSVDSLFIPMNYNGLREIAKHFYELGLKAKKGE